LELTNFTWNFNFRFLSKHLRFLTKIVNFYIFRNRLEKCYLIIYQSQIWFRSPFWLIWGILFLLWENFGFRKRVQRAPKIQNVFELWDLGRHKNLRSKSIRPISRELQARVGKMKIFSEIFKFEKFFRNFHFFRNFQFFFNFRIFQRFLFRRFLFQRFLFQRFLFQKFSIFSEVCIFPEIFKFLSNFPFFRNFPFF